MKNSILQNRERLACLNRYRILDTAPEDAFDEIARLASVLCGTPMAMVGFVDAHREWFKAKIGFECPEVALAVSLGARVVERRELVVLTDAESESRLEKLRKAIFEPGCRFFASAPIIAPDGYVVGTLTVADHVRRTLTSEQREQLLVLARIAGDRLDLRLRRMADATEVGPPASHNGNGVSHGAGRDVRHWEWEIGEGEHRWSPQHKKILGGPDQEVSTPYQSWTSCVHPEDRERVLTAVVDHLENYLPFDIEYRIRFNGGEYRWIRDEGQVDRDAQGRPYRMSGKMTELVHGYADDEWSMRGHSLTLDRCCLEATAQLKRTNAALLKEIEERKRAEHALRKEKELWNAVFDNLKDGIVACDTKGSLILLNRACQEFHGPISGPLPVERWAESYNLFDENGRNQLDPERIPLYRALNGEFVQDVEMVVIPKTGQARILLANGQPLTTPAGEALGAFVVMQDITERSLAVQELRQSEERFRQLEENVREVFWIIGPQGHDVTYISPSFERVWGRCRSELEKVPGIWAESLHPEDRLRVLATVIRQSRLGLSWEHEYRIRRPDESIRWIKDRGFPISDGSGKVHHIFGIAEDITDQKKAELEILGLNWRLEKRLERLGALRRVDVAMSTTLDLRVTLQILLEVATDQLEVDAASVLGLDPHSLTLSYLARRGFRTNKNAHARIRLGEGLAGRIAKERSLIELPNVSDSGEAHLHSAHTRDEGFVSYYGLPLLCRGHAKGVLEIHHRTPIELDSEALYFLEVLASQAAIAIDNSMLFDEWERFNLELVQAYDATIEGWSRALDLRDRATEGHTQRVTEMSERLACAMGIREQDLVHIRRGAMLHDIGKMGIPDSILLKPGPLTPEEQQIMQRHPTYAYEWLSSIAFLRPALDIPHCHHEHWNGTGYPRGLKGDQIPLAARIFTAVDIWDALRSDRPYRPGWPEEQVRRHLEELSGSLLDPTVVTTFLRVLNEKEEVVSSYSS